MDDDVAGIDQHPVAMGKAFDASASEAFVLELPDEVIGNGADMPLRAPRGYDHLVADRGLALDVDGDDVLGLGICRVCRARRRANGSGLREMTQSRREAYP